MSLCVCVREMNYQSFPAYTEGSGWSCDLNCTEEEECKIDGDTGNWTCACQQGFTCTKKGTLNSYTTQ